MTPPRPPTRRALAGCALALMAILAAGCDDDAGPTTPAPAPPPAPEPAPPPAPAAADEVVDRATLKAFVEAAAAEAASNIA